MNCWRRSSSITRVIGIRERALFGIARRAGADGIALDHPPAAEPQHRIQTGAQGVHFGRSGRHHVGTAIRPAGQKRAILLSRMPSSISA